MTRATRSRSWPVVAGLTILAACITLAGLSVLSAVGPGSENLPSRPSAFDVLVTLSIVLLFPVVGVAVIWRQPRNAVGWLFLAVGFGMIANTFASEYGDRAVYGPTRLLGAELAIWVESWAWLVTVGLAAPLAIALFPDGALPGRRWRPVMTFVATSVVVLSVASALLPGPLLQESTVENPIGVEALRPWIELINTVATLPVLAMITLGLAAIVVRFRRSHGVERQQLKVLLYPLSVIAVGFVIALVSVTILQVDIPLAWQAILIGLAGVPIAAGVAILRYRLFDIDVVIRRTLVYAVVVAILGLVYVGLVLGLQAPLSGITGGDTLPVAISTLVIAALFGPVRGRVRRAIDRRFFRSRYDTQRTLEGFAGRLRDQVELESVGFALADSASLAVQPASIGVWLRRTPP